MAYFAGKLEEDIEFENCMNSDSGKIVLPSFTMLPNDIHRNILWQKWRGSPRASTIWLLIGYIIRRKMNNPIADKIYYEYYKKRKLLVARYTQQGLADLFGYNDRRGINNHIKACEKEGVLKVEEMPWKSRKIKIYIFGSWQKLGDAYVETLDMFTKFRKEEAKRRLEEEFKKQG
jgi:hypothetical protein